MTGAVRSQLLEPDIPTDVIGLDKPAIVEGSHSGKQLYFVTDADRRTAGLASLVLSILALIKVMKFCSIPPVNRGVDHEEICCVSRSFR